mgnify:FL=1
MSTPAMAKAMSVIQYARKMRVRFDTVKGWIQSGQLRAVNVAPRVSDKPHWRITLDAAAEFERKRSSEIVAKPKRKARRGAKPPLEFEYFK